MKRKIVISFVILIVILLIVFFYSVPIPSFGSHNFYRLNEPLSCKNFNKIIFVSDTQKPIPVEEIFLSENHNLLARSMIFEKILKEKPTAVFHLGDIVDFGYDDKTGLPIDNFVKQLNREGSLFYPIVGNHEYLLFPNLGVNNFKRRYPFAKLTGYSVACGNIEVILLNSVFDDLSPQEIQKQNEFYKNAIRSAEKNDKIKFLIVATHYSPFTNSKIVSPSEDVQKEFLPLFFNSSKAKLFISGHAHAFEHFKIRGKDFLVIGGGGGLQQPLFTGAEEKYHDLFNETLQKRMFHFIEINSVKDTLNVFLNMIKDDFSGFEQKYEIHIP